MCKVKPKIYKTSSYCKECHYGVTRKTQNKKIKEFKEFMELAKDQPCRDCGVKYPSYVMDFDHLPEFKKSKSISQMAFYSHEEIKTELLKCELVCSNCHRERTHKRRFSNKVNKI